MCGQVRRAKTRELAASAARIEGWRNTRSYYAFISDLAAHSRDPTSPTSPVSMTNMLGHTPARPYVDLYHSLAKLRTLHLSPKDAGAIYLALEAHCTDYDSILELLEMAPMSEAGLFHVGLGLWHEDRHVREAVTALLDRIRKHPAGRVFFNRMGGWATMGFNRRVQEKESRLRTNQAEADDMLGPLPLDVDVRRS